MLYFLFVGARGLDRSFERNVSYVLRVFSRNFEPETTSNRFNVADEKDRGSRISLSGTLNRREADKESNDGFSKKSTRSFTSNTRRIARFTLGTKRSAKFVACSAQRFTRINEFNCTRNVSNTLALKNQAQSVHPSHLRAINIESFTAIDANYCPCDAQRRPIFLAVRKSVESVVSKKIGYSNEENKNHERFNGEKEKNSGSVVGYEHPTNVYDYVHTGVRERKVPFSRVHSVPSKRVNK